MQGNVQGKATGLQAHCCYTNTLCSLSGMVRLLSRCCKTEAVCLTLAFPITTNPFVPSLWVAPHDLHTVLPKTRCTCVRTHDCMVVYSPGQRPLRVPDALAHCSCELFLHQEDPCPATRRKTSFALINKQLSMGMVLRCTFGPTLLKPPPLYNVQDNNAAKEKVCLNSKF